MSPGELAAQDSTEKADERLLVQAAQKDPARFAELYELNFERVYAFAIRRLHNREAAEDLTAEVFRKALANLQRYKWRDVPFVAWLFRIASNLIADQAKRSAKEKDVVANKPGESTTEPSTIEAVEKHARLFRLVQQLPNDQRRVIEMRFADEKSIREIASELGRTEGAIKQLQFRGLQNLRAGLSQADGK